MKSYRVLVVDDSALMRLEIRRLIERDAQMSVVGIADSGEEAIRLVRELHPDVVTLDVEMRGMNGIDTLRALMKDTVIPVVMLASRTRYSQSASIKALEAGAVDFFLKDLVLYKDAREENRQEFFVRLKSAAAANLKASPAFAMGPVSQGLPGWDEEAVKERTARGPADVALIVIGSSTGGPNAVQQVLKGLPADLAVPVIVAQHMPPGFTLPFSEHLNQAVSLQVKELTDGEELHSACVYICPSGAQTIITRQAPDKLAAGVQVDLEDRSLYKPSVNTLFLSVAAVLGGKAVGVILTGMGSDGLIGCQAIHDKGGCIIAESRETAVIYGMPRVVTEAGIADVSARLTDIGNEILKCL
jgi:two-component system, chemotaxis family, protein-glutamate methylesterase/glutaminase